MRSLAVSSCLLFIACSTGPVDRATTAEDADRLGGKDPSAYQLRVTGVCPAGQFTQSVGVDGTVTCATPDMSAADILGVTTSVGSGLIGGATSGEVSLALAVCPAGQVLKNDGAGWACAADADLLATKTCALGQVLRFDGTTWACAADADLLASTTCAAGQVLRFDGTQWGCAADADSFATRACPSGQVLKSNGAGWLCAADDDTPLPSCGQGQVIKSNGTTWLCANDETTSGSNVSCPAGQVLKSNGAGYVCSADDGIRTVSTVAGSGLVGGDSTSTVSLALAPCADGQLQKAIDGGWACAGDDGLTAVTTAVNGGLTGGATALSLTGCAAGEVLKSNGTGWACAADTGLTTVTPRSGGGLVGGATTLALAPCALNEVLKSTSTGDWICAPDQNAGGDVTGVVTPATGGIVGGAASGDATLTLTNCPVGQVLKSTGPNTWTCQADADSGGDITAVNVIAGAGLIGGGGAGVVSVGLRACASNEILKFVGTGWTCAADSNSGVVTPATGGIVGGSTTGDATLTLTTCPVGQVLKSTGTNTWACAADANAGGDLTGVITPSTGGLVGGATAGDSTLTLANCPSGQVLKSTGTNTWACAADANAGGDLTGVITPATGGLVGGSTSGDSTLTLTPCALDQVLRFDGAQWSCAAYTAPYAAGAGITIASGTISAGFLTPGSEAGVGTSVARADHVHDTRYQPLSIRTIVVRGGGTPAQNGAAMLAAINGITGASGTNRWLVKLEPGEYDLGTSGFSGKSWVDLEGSGRNVTSVRGAPNGPVLNMPEVSEVRELTVIHPGGTNNAIAVQLSTASGANGAAVARRITAAASGGNLFTYPINITGTGIARLEDSQVQMTVTAGTGYALVAGANSQPIIRRSNFILGGAGDAMVTAYGLYFTSGSLILENSKIVSTATVFTTGIYGGATGSSMAITGLEVDMTTGLVNSRALDFRGGTVELRNGVITTATAIYGLVPIDTDIAMRNVEINTTDLPSMFVWHGPASTTRKISLESCLLDSGTAPTIAFRPATGAGVENVFMGATQLNSSNPSSVAPSAGSTLKCVASYNENFDPVGSNCN